MTCKIGTSETLSVYSKEIQPINTLKSTYYDINNENDASGILDTLMEVLPTQQKMMTNDSDGLKLNSADTTIKLKSFEKVFDELETKNQFIRDQVILYTGKNKLNEDQNTIIKTKLNKIKNDIDKICNKKVSREMDNFKNFQFLFNKTTEIDNRIGQFILETKTLKTIAENACENKHIMKDMMKLLDYLKEQHRMQLTENQKYFNEQTSKFKHKIEELQAYADSKVEEVETLEERVMHQEHYINFCEDSIRRVEEFITEKLTILVPYTTELEVTIENQKKIISQIVEKLEEMDKTPETEDMQEMIQSLDN